MYMIVSIQAKSALGRGCLGPNEKFMMSANIYIPVSILDRRGRFKVCRHRRDGSTVNVLNLVDTGEGRGVPDD